MIIYKELNILEDGLLHFYLEVEELEYYNDIVISGVRLDTPLTYGTDTPFKELINPDLTKEFKSSWPLPPSNQLFLIITPIIKGTPSYDTPCGKDIIDKGIVYNKKYIQSQGLGYLKELGDSCTTPKGFIDYILRVKALDMAIATCNYAEAIKYWDFLTKRKVKTSTNNCGCHGLN